MLILLLFSIPSLLCLTTIWIWFLHEYTDSHFIVHRVSSSAISTRQFSKFQIFFFSDGKLLFKAQHQHAAHMF